MDENPVVKKSEFKTKRSFTERMRENPWIVSTLILGVLVLVFLVTSSGVTGRITGNVVSEKDIGQQVLSYYESNGVSGLTLDSVKEVSGLYVVNFNYQGQVVPIYVTKDGKYSGSLTPLSSGSSDNSNTNTQAQEIPKTTKPSVELYVFTYCPYGLQMEKAMLPVARLLANKIDFKVRQIGAMHGEFEKIEAERQLCIEKEYPTKILDYMVAFAEDTSIGDCRGDAVCVAPKLNSLFTKLGISKSKIEACMTKDGEALYNAEVSNANSKGVGGSPTIIINGVNAQLSRSPEAVKTAICDSFSNAPSECSQVLSSDQASPGFGTSTGSGSASGIQCGV